jgi:hypothetical protein
MTSAVRAGTLWQCEQPIIVMDMPGRLALGRALGGKQMLNRRTLICATGAEKDFV